MTAGLPDRLIICVKAVIILSLSRIEIWLTMLCVRKEAFFLILFVSKKYANNPMISTAAITTGRKRSMICFLIGF